MRRARGLDAHSEPVCGIECARIARSTRGAPRALADVLVTCRFQHSVSSRVAELARQLCAGEQKQKRLEIEDIS